MASEHTASRTLWVMATLYSLCHTRESPARGTYRTLDGRVCVPEERSDGQGAAERVPPLHRSVCGRLASRQGASQTSHPPYAPHREQKPPG